MNLTLNEAGTGPFGVDRLLMEVLGSFQLLDGSAIE
jgi:hypothetical protein